MLAEAGAQGKLACPRISLQDVLDEVSMVHTIPFTFFDYRINPTGFQKAKLFFAYLL